MFTRNAVITRPAVASAASSLFSRISNVNVDVNQFVGISKGRTVRREQASMRSRRFLVAATPCSAFSTSGTSITVANKDEVKGTNNEDAVSGHKDILAAASIRASQISALVASLSRNTDASALAPSLHQPGSPSTLGCATDEAQQQAAVGAIEAVDALLSLTSGPSFVTALSRRRGGGTDAAACDDVACLHRAFLAVASWCTASADGAPAPTVFVQKTLDLCRRAEQLSLPFHFPLYRRIAEDVVAQHSAAPAPLLLDLSASVARSLGAPVDGTFFSGSLLVLTRRRKLRDAVALIRAIQTRHGIDALGGDVAFQVLTLVKEGVNEAIAQATDGAEGSDDLENFNDSDALELTVLLKEPLLRELERTKESLLLALREVTGNSRESTPVDSDSSDESDDNEGELSEALEQILDAFNRGGSPSADDAEYDDSSVATVSGVLDFDAETGNVENINLSILPPQLSEAGMEEGQQNPPNKISVSSPRQRNSSGGMSERIHKSLAKDLVYVRDETCWTLPDVVPQLVEWNMGRDILFTKEYEEYLIRQITDEHENEDMEDLHDEFFGVD